MLAWRQFREALGAAFLLAGFSVALLAAQGWAGFMTLPGSGQVPSGARPDTFAAPSAYPPVQVNVPRASIFSIN